MREVKALFRPQRLNHVIEALRHIPNLPGVTLSKVHGYAGTRPFTEHPGSTQKVETDFVKLETVVPSELVERVVAAIGQAGHTGRPGDGIVFVVPVEDFMRIRDVRRAEPADGTTPAA